MTNAQSPSELASGIVGHYEKHGHAWDADRRANRWNDKPWHDRFIAALPACATVLDLGCGGGAPVVLNMVERGLRVTGVDAARVLITLCRARLPDQNWVVGDMRSLSLGKRFDGILAWDSFFHLKPDDQRAMFDVFAAHAGSRAYLMFNTGPSHGESIGCYHGDALYHASLDAAEYAELLGLAGFGVVDHTVEDWKNGGGRTVWMARSVA